jgi:hypothetical protein
MSNSQFPPGSFRIDKRRVAATVRLDTGAALEGAFLCAGQTAGHSGRETVVDLLNGSCRFVPFFPNRSSSPVLVSTRAIIVAELDASERDGAGDDWSETRSVTIMLRAQGEITGDVTIVAPVGHRRTLDLVNEGGSFVLLDAGARLLVVNLDLALIVADASPA